MVRSKVAIVIKCDERHPKQVLLDYNETYLFLINFCINSMNRGTFQKAHFENSNYGLRAEAGKA